MLLSPPDGCGLFRGCHKRIRPRVRLLFPADSRAKMSSQQFYSGTLRGAPIICAGWCEIGQVSLGRWQALRGAPRRFWSYWNLTTASVSLRSKSDREEPR